MRVLVWLREQLMSRQCTWCSGRGTYMGFSPFDSLKTIRRQQILTCYHCHGTGVESAKTVEGQL